MLPLKLWTTSHFLSPNMEHSNTACMYLNLFSCLLSFFLHFKSRQLLIRYSDQTTRSIDNCYKTHLFKFIYVYCILFGRSVGRTKSGSIVWAQLAHNFDQNLCFHDSFINYRLDFLVAEWFIDSMFGRDE